MNTKLNSIIQDDSEMLWCAPAAICAVSGKPTSEINKICHRYKEELHNFHSMVVVNILEDLGYTIVVHSYHEPILEIAQRKKHINLLSFKTYCTYHKDNIGHIIATNNSYFVDNTRLYPTKLLISKSTKCWFIEVKA